MALTVNITGGRSKRRPYELESYIYVNPVYVVGNCWRVTGRLGSRPLQRDLLHIPCPYSIKALVTLLPHRHIISLLLLLSKKSFDFSGALPAPALGEESGKRNGAGE